MKYQEVYNGLNKKASNEQIKKLASIIGMKKRAYGEDAIRELACTPANWARMDAREFEDRASAANNIAAGAMALKTRRRQAELAAQLTNAARGARQLYRNSLQLQKRRAKQIGQSFRRDVDLLSPSYWLSKLFNKAR